MAHGFMAAQADAAKKQMTAAGMEETQANAWLQWIIDHAPSLEVIEKAIAYVSTNWPGSTSNLYAWFAFLSGLYGIVFNSAPLPTPAVVMGAKP